MTQTENFEKTDRTLLKNIFSMISISLIGAVIAYGSSFSVNKSWIAEAKVERPNVVSLGNYYSLSSTYQFIQDQDNNNIDETDIVYHEFRRQLNSDNLIRHFWQTSEYYKQKQTGESHIDLALLEKLIKNIKFQMGHSNELADTITLELENPKLATELLSAFIDYVNQETRQVIYSNLITKWKVVFERVKNATEFNLGKNTSNVVDFKQDWQGQLQMMRAVSPLDEQFTAYRYAKRPTQPLDPASPNRLCWGISGAIIGFLVALLFLVVFNSRNKIIK
ncbi:LPS chain length-determining protein [Pasteurella canis]|uniref:ECA polysaccharide chain length modulation protein n=1 Tax=Pasteurella canis TaxID=753 RepID=A0ABQ4VJT6_9PAST|nr:LPS chain length-determining protein [Pasteurella canis]UEC23731.1 LPS chain length-determining protein [Pasteurella canis]GJH42557.1 ECA polysaccharide chain length modulation protein [Pasteurella canis]GJJ80546.1 ECA polysaccharide chain length modulation protein [Pasteurella canis]